MHFDALFDPFGPIRPICIATGRLICIGSASLPCSALSWVLHSRGSAYLVFSGRAPPDKKTGVSVVSTEYGEREEGLRSSLTRRNAFLVDSTVRECAHMKHRSESQVQSVACLRPADKTAHARARRTAPALYSMVSGEPA